VRSGEGIAWVDLCSRPGGGQYAMRRLPGAEVHSLSLGCARADSVDGKMMIVDGIERKERTESHVYVEYIVSRDA
jgi:hypothetical protein